MSVMSCASLMLWLMVFSLCFSQVSLFSSQFFLSDSHQTFSPMWAQQSQPLFYGLFVQFLLFSPSWDLLVLVLVFDWFWLVQWLAWRHHGHRFLFQFRWSLFLVEVSISVMDPMSLQPQATYRLCDSTVWHADKLLDCATWISQTAVWQ